MTPAQIAAKLKAKGQPMTLSRVTAGTYDPVTGNTAGATPQTFTVHGIMTNFNSIQRLASQGVEVGTLIQAGDRLAIIDATQCPVPTDTLTVGGITWTVIGVDAIDPAGEALLFKCHVRR